MFFLRTLLLRALPVAAALAVSIPAAAPAADVEPNGIGARIEEIDRRQENLAHRLDELAKAIDDILWFQRVGDVAVVDKWRVTGPPPARPRDPKAPGASNPVKFWTYSFVPRHRKAGEKLPLLVLPHGGIHSDFTSSYAHIIRELVGQGYIVLAPEYRGSTGYGREHYELVDYGGREVDDIHAARAWAVENLEGVDPARVGLIGWSHGGLIALLEAATRGSAYRCVYAGVPVSDLLYRIEKAGVEYEREFTAAFHIGKSPKEDPEEYKRRSPTSYAAQINLPLLIHTNTNDEDVTFGEVELMAKALREAGKKFEYRVFENAPGGHHVDRIDSKIARDARRDVYRFLAKHLQPPRPVK